MCTNCDDNSIVLPLGDPGVAGSDGVGTDGLNGVEERVIFDTSLHLTYTTTEFTASMPLLDDGLTYDTAAFREIGWFIFPGTDNLQGNIPTSAYLAAYMVTPVKWAVRIKANGLVVAQSTALNVVAISIFALGTVTNLPTDVSIMSIEVIPLTNDVVGTIHIKSLTLLK